MTRYYSTWIVGSFLMAGAFSCQLGRSRPGGSVDPSTTPTALTLVATNDIHGALAAHTERIHGASLKVGGLSALSGYLKILRQENPNGTALFDAGDMFQGTLMSNIAEGETVIDVMNLLGYEAAALGNHEFDFGPVGAKSVVTSAEQDPFGALKLRVKQARFPILSANVGVADTPGRSPAFLSHGGVWTMSIAGVRVGVVGLITAQTPEATNPLNIRALEFRPLVEAALEAVAAVRKQGAKVVVGLVHAGGRCEQLSDPHDVSSCDVDEGEIFSLLDALPEHTFDAVFAGHTHAPIGHFYRGTPVVESSGLGRSFGIIELQYDRRQQAVIRSATRLEANIPICETVDQQSGSCRRADFSGAVEHVVPVPAVFHGKVVVPDAKVTALVARAQAAVRSLQDRKLGVAVPSSLRRNYVGPSSLADAVADALRTAANADFALMNAGGLRADIDDGELTYGDLFEVLPFDNTIAVLSIPGRDVLRMLDVAFAARRGVPGISGLRLVVGRCGGGLAPITVRTANGDSVDADKVYRVATLDFLVHGGDGFGSFMRTLPPESIDFGNGRGTNYRDDVVEVWSRLGRPLVAPPAGRLRFSRDEPAQCKSASNPRASKDHLQ